MKELILNFKNNSTKILIGESFLNLSNLCNLNKSILITDTNLSSIYKDQLPDIRLIEISPGENSKSIETITYIIDKLLDFNIDRDFTIIAFGGGVISDISGFVASIYNRGIKFGIVASTLLSQVDASIGGKNGININAFKNKIGTFYQPEFIISDLNLLKTLSIEEFNNGIAEIIKTSLIDDETFFEIVEKSDISTEKLNELEEIVHRTAQIKSKIVQNDEIESNLRRILNFGHTFGHAIELEYNLPHGKAISLGMIQALEISNKLLNFPKNKIKRIKELFVKYNLLPEINTNKKKIIEIIQKDKKRESDYINFILLEDIGKPVIKEISINYLSELM
jgi:3-dehydroquinate synthase